MYARDVLVWTHNNKQGRGGWGNGEPGAGRRATRSTAALPDHQYGQGGEKKGREGSRAARALSRAFHIATLGQ